MQALDLSMNMMSLGGIAMGVGMIVDNSIVVLENIYRFSADGHDRMSACIDGTKEVTSSVVASTLTTLAVFLTLGLVNGLAGMMFRDFCLTIASLVGASLVIALTLVPLLCYFMLDEEKVRRQRLKQAEKKKSGFLLRCSAWMQNLKDSYLRLLDYFVHHLKAGMLAATAMVAVFGISIFTTNMVLIPDMDQSMVSVNVTMPIGSSLEETTAIADRVAHKMQEIPEMTDMFYIAQDESGQHFHRCGRRQSGTVRNIAEQHEIHTGLHFHALLAERPHHTLRVVRPVCFLLRL